MWPNILEGCPVSIVTFFLGKRDVFVPFEKVWNSTDQVLAKRTWTKVVGFYARSPAQPETCFSFLFMLYKGTSSSQENLNLFRSISSISIGLGLFTYLY